MNKKERWLKKAFKQMLRAQEPTILAKLMKNERKYHFGWSWRSKNWEPHLHRDLPHHVTKGDPTDVIIYGSFALYHGWRTAPLVLDNKQPCPSITPITPTTG